jgi:hypothetical protein
MPLVDLLRTILDPIHFGWYISYTYILEVGSTLVHLKVQRLARKISFQRVPVLMLTFVTDIEHKEMKTKYKDNQLCDTGLYPTSETSCI